jgi:hypothetical protein
MMRNVVPSGAVLGRYPFLRGAIPAAVLEGRRFPLTRVHDAARVEHTLNRPGVLGPPSGLPGISRAIPKFTPTRSTGAVGWEGLGGLKGMTLPRQAERPLTPFMRQQIRIHRQLQGPSRIETRPEFRPLARPETPQVEVIRGLTTQNVHSPGGGGFQAAPGATTPEVIRGGAPRKFQPASSREFRQPAAGGFRAVSPRVIRQPSGFRTSVPQEFQAAPAPFFRPEPRATFGTRAIGPARRGSGTGRTFSSPSHRR